MVKLFKKYIKSNLFSVISFFLHRKLVYIYVIYKFHFLQSFYLHWKLVYVPNLEFHAISFFCIYIGNWCIFM